VTVSGTFEQEIVINTGSVNAAVYDDSVRMETFAVPDSPAVSVFAGVVAGVIFEMAGMKSHSAVTLTAKAAEDELP